jgi:hypothetical protein
MGRFGRDGPDVLGGRQNTMVSMFEHPVVEPAGHTL